MESVPAKPSNKSASSQQPNRRRGNRHRLDIPATLTLDGEHPIEISVTVTEMSVGGVCFHSPQELKLDATYRVVSFDTLIPHAMRACIVSQKQLPDGQFKIGAKAL